MGPERYSGRGDLATEEYEIRPKRVPYRKDGSSTFTVFEVFKWQPGGYVYAITFNSRFDALHWVGERTGRALA
jgi:hypothetical protein